ncbi:FAD-dependent monooxygenase [Streptomyces melanosporofaciens]|uniref:2-polyprenyl-6-methoxyphenol hydroxylase n=1 Tax=Streptomyces melanosporofaciens TaxID=67327 RepID=A0A1H4PHL7_STRMJ|nr:FAD-dependent monooxygenase [Streptomyces melanosporofaciens]SEC06943.1 2-polyprenyl-6-methoxyphenol hydroxylase [Streptomyces melanosporofaciens]
MEFNNVKDADVLIAGAGPAGLTLAVDLARRGVRARVVERGEGLFPGSRGKGLQPRTQEVFDDLGVGEAMRAAGGPYPPMMRWEDERRLGTFEMMERIEPTPDRPYHEALMLPQWRTAEILHARLEELGGGVEFGTALTGLEPDGDGVTAHLTYADGSAGTVRAAYLVAADGGRSTVRKALGIGMTGEAVDPAPSVVADVVIDGAERGLDRDHWHVWWHAKGGGIALCPLAGTDHFQVTAQYDDPDAVPDASPEAVRQLIADRTALAASDVREVRWASVFTPRAAMADRFRAGRVFLVGDAAHIHSPAGAQGLNTSVQDAYNLGWKLGQVLRHGADPALLDSYEAERLPVAAGVLGISTRIHRAHRAGDAKGARRAKEVHQLELSYRDGPLAVDDRDQPGQVGAGDRAPDAPCALPDGTRVRLFDMLRGPHFTLLVLGGATPPTTDFGGLAATLAAAECLRTIRIGGPNPDLLDADGHLAAAYGPGPAALLIRPDGYVCWATEGARVRPTR